MDNLHKNCLVILHTCGCFKVYLFDISCSLRHTDCAMSVYHEVGRIIDLYMEKQYPLKTLCYNSKYKDKKQLLALASKTIEKTEKLDMLIETLSDKIRNDLKRKFRGGLLYVLIYEEFFSRGGIRCKELHLKLKPFLPELKEKVFAYKHGKEYANNNVHSNIYICTVDDVVKHYNYCVRVNTLKINVTDFIVKMTEKFGYLFFETSKDLIIHIKKTKNCMNRKNLKRFFIHDDCFSELFYFFRGIDLHNNPLYIDSSFIIQSKASCLAAYALNPSRSSFVIDACSAPGNKTSLLAAIMNNTGKIFACELDKPRYERMIKSLERRGVANTMCTNRNFLELRPFVGPYASVRYILVDPSCSGSGTSKCHHKPVSKSKIKSYVQNQLQLLHHALSFPKVKRVIYSTCSIFKEENEDVVRCILKKYSPMYRLVRPFNNANYYYKKCTDKNTTFIELNTISFDPREHHTEGFFIACFEKIRFLKQVGSDFFNYPFPNGLRRNYFIISKNHKRKKYILYNHL